MDGPKEPQKINSTQNGLFHHGKRAKGVFQVKRTLNSFNEEAFFSDFCNTMPRLKHEIKERSTLLDSMKEQQECCRMQMEEDLAMASKGVALLEYNTLQKEKEEESEDDQVDDLMPFTNNIGPKWL